MTPRPNRPLARRLVRSVYSVYLVLAVLVTVVHVALEYRNTYEQVRTELDAATHSFEPGIADAIWNYQGQLVHSIAKGAVDGRLVLGIRVVDRAGHIDVALSSGGVSLSTLGIARRMELFHTSRGGLRENIGSMTLYSSYTVALERVSFGVLLTAAGAALKTLGLWLIIVYFANRLLAEPLRRFTGQIAVFDVSQLPNGAAQIDLGRVESTELVYLRDAFNELGRRVFHNRQALVDLANSLEARVTERTAQLHDKNAALEREVAERSRAEAEVARERDFSVALVKSIPELMFLVGPDGTIEMANPNAQRDFGLPDGPSGGMRLQQFVRQDDLERVALMLEQAMCHGHDGCEADLVFRESRTAVAHQLLCRRVQDSDRLIVVAVDISARRKTEEEMRHMALYDPLTDLPNRAMLQDRLVQEAALCVHRKEMLAVLFIDLDGFKAVNDNAGHDVGDVVLKAVAARLQQTLRVSDTVARIGGDEFIAIVPGLTDIAAVLRIGEKLIEAVSRPVEHAGTAYTVGASIGISLMPLHTNSVDRLLELADAAMYQAKRGGKGRCELAQGHSG